MEVVDNVVMMLVPGAMDAGLTSPLFWGALAFALVVAGAFAYPLNRRLIARGRGHAVVHSAGGARRRARRRAHSAAGGESPAAGHAIEPTRRPCTG